MLVSSVLSLFLWIRISSSLLPTCIRDESLPFSSPRFLMHKFSFVPALGSFCSNCLFYFWWLNNNLAAVPCCVYHMLLWFMGSFNWILLFPGKQGNPLYCSATLPIYPVCAKMHADGFVFQIRLADPKYNSMRQRSAQNLNSDGEMEPSVCVAELQTQGRGRAFKCSRAAGEFMQEHGARVCVQGDRGALCPCELMGESLRR